MHLTERLERCLRGQDGFTMPLVMGALLVATILGVAAFGSARGEIGTSATARDRKQAYAAAEAGINWYGSKLSGDNAYWAKCTDVPEVAPGTPAPVNQAWDGTGSDPRRWRQLTGSTAQYTLELLPAKDRGQCEKADPDGSMLDKASGTFRIRATGRYRGLKRSVVAQFRRARFLDFLYFTDFETFDPIAYPAGSVAYANANCGNRYRSARGSSCSEIQFAPGDAINGPLHSNDSLYICGTPTFGRNGNDSVESSQNEDTRATGSPSPGWRPACAGTTPNFTGAFRYAQPTVTMPATNAELKTSSLAANTFAGTTTIVLDGSTDRYTVTNAQVNGGSPKTLPWPDNGLIYVNTRTSGTGSGCGSTQIPAEQTYTEPDGCANVFVKGTYGKDLTIASAKDVVVDGDVTQIAGSDAVAGLIADNFVRVYHPVDNSRCGSSAGNLAGSMTTVKIQAALLSLQHSFTVDNHDCGTGFGRLTVVGAIAQKYRGPVGTSNSSYRTGYTKDYNYDDRLLYRNPPFFLDPVNAAWRVLRTNEQVPAR